jgi:hypothetical protein
MSATKSMAFIAAALVATSANAKNCPPFGYVTCSITKWCLNWCAEWEKPQTGDQGLDRDLLFNPVLKFPEVVRHWALPPLKYDHEFAGELILKRGTSTEVTAWCFRDHPVIGCAAPRNGGASCEVWIITDEELEKRKISWDIVFRHEQGHCNGWKHDPQPGILQ